MLDVRLAGGLELRLDGAPIALPASRRARAVLAFLALNPAPQPRGRLAARFWPDVLDESARASLRVALTELRQALGPASGYVVATRETVALEDPDLRVDTREFQRELDDGDATRALEACGATILDGFDEEWAISAREEHAQRLAGALQSAAASALDPAESLRLTRAEAALDPLAERPNRRLIERLATTGDRAAALSAGRQFAERLRAQLGIAPSRDTRALIDDLRREDTEPVPTPPGLTRSYETGFVGRRGELARLRACWGGVQMHRDRRIAVVAGEPGIGKTRLARRFAAAAVDEGATVLLGRCSEEPLAPFEPYAEALAQAGAAEALTPSTGSDDATARHRLFDAIDAALGDLAARAPLLLVIDDLHWADRGSLLLTSFLLRSSRPGPILVVATYRDTELGRHTPLTATLGELKQGGAVDRIALRGLRLNDVATLTRSMLGTDEIASRVHARTDGNAFFVEEVLRELAEPGPQVVPESVRHAVGLRLSRMGDEANELIAAAAILGLEHDARALQATSGLQADAAEAALDEILRARLLRATSSPRRFEFAHALVREAVLDECNVLRRDRGGTAIVGSIFDHVPGAGAWRTALLLDGNIGIGGAPERLLTRIRSLLGPAGEVIAELDPPGMDTESLLAQIETRAEVSASLRWARVAFGDIEAIAAAAGYTLLDCAHHGARWFARLGRESVRPGSQLTRRSACRFHADLSTSRITPAPHDARPARARSVVAARGQPRPERR